ncbi:MAG TPA: GTP-binding protein, partial [Gemmataceae bacterium]|nr:GTP-binding protein [Gemmataceae bacterium]
MRENPIFVDQIMLADVVVMNKLDTAPLQLVADFHGWANALFPPKLLIAGTEYGRLDPAWLDLTADDERLPLFPEAHEHVASRERERQEDVPPLARDLGLLHLRQSPPGVRPACCGWVFCPTTVFLLDRLRDLLGSTPGVSRLKGVFRTEHDEWYAFNRVHGSTDVRPTAYRRDSRVEVFAESLDVHELAIALRWEEFTVALIKCMVPAAPPNW